jgi:hypothetical protein
MADLRRSNAGILVSVPVKATTFQQVQKPARGDEGKMPNSARNTVVCFQYPLIEAPNTKDKIGYG